MTEGGARANAYDLPFPVILDAQPVARLSQFNAGGAPSWRLTPEALNAFDGLAGRSWRGSAFFAGPIFHSQINEKSDLSGGFTSGLLAARAAIRAR